MKVARSIAAVPWINGAAGRCGLQFSLFECPDVRQKGLTRHSRVAASPSGGIFRPMAWHLIAIVGFPGCTSVTLYCVGCGREVTVSRAVGTRRVWMAIPVAMGACCRTVTLTAGVATRALRSRGATRNAAVWAAACNFVTPECPAWEHTPGRRHNLRLRETPSVNGTHLEWQIHGLTSVFWAVAY
jgi:hypothetical protein